MVLVQIYETPNSRYIYESYVLVHLIFLQSKEIENKITSFQK